jgi:peroxiredoxin
MAGIVLPLPPLIPARHRVRSSGGVDSSEFQANLCGSYHKKTMALNIGTQAPDFTLKTMTADGLVDVTLSTNFGKQATVILFFPLAFTGVCTQELCDVTAGLGKYAELKAEVLGISVDSPFAQAAWAKKEGITIKLLSDLNKTVTAAYDVVFPGLAGIGDTSARAAFVIDASGKIVYSEQTATPKDLPDFEKIEAALKAL